MERKSLEHNQQEESGAVVLAKAAALAELVDYQAGSVVSRTVIDRKTGTVTLFAFDKGQGLSEHTAPFDALVYIIDGHAEITINRKAQSVRQGEMIIMPASKPHALRAPDRFKMMLIMIRS
jgi:quercetin dioxygenase-like cupin family protein